MHRANSESRTMHLKVGARSSFLVLYMYMFRYTIREHAVARKIPKSPRCKHKLILWLTMYIRCHMGYVET